jgi:DNA polymerase III alpha subunit
MVIRKKRLTKIKGNLLKVKHIRTQRGSRMAHVFVRHGKGEVKAVLFPSLYEVMRKVSSRIFKKNAYMEISGHWEQSGNERRLIAVLMKTKIGDLIEVTINHIT